MKINPVSSVAGQYAKLKTYTEKEQPTYSAGSDKIELSEQAKMFSEAMALAKKAASGVEVDNKARIEELRAQIQSATYSVDAREIAKKMLMV